MAARPDTEPRRHLDMEEGGRLGTVYANGRHLRCGYTTGTCAAAASKAAVLALLSGVFPDTVVIETPNGRSLELKVESPSRANGVCSCAVRKDAGDDADATDGILIFSAVSKRQDGMIAVDGGAGVGRVTRKGLDQPPGHAAINRVPREMIRSAVEGVCAEYGHVGGADVIISIPEGERISGKTFNPRLGIEGGISVLGTSGIVEPMSSRAIVETIRAEMSVRRAAGDTCVLVVPGNYGSSYLRDMGLDASRAVTCSNFIGEAVDLACEMGFGRMLLVGNLGKLVKVAGGIMDTHSRNGDCRMEIMASACILTGGTADEAARILRCGTTDEALGIIWDTGRKEEFLSSITDRIGFHLNNRAGGNMDVASAVFSSEYGFLGGTLDYETTVSMLKETGQ